MNNLILNLLKSKDKGFKVYYGNGEIIELYNANYSLDYDGWITVTNKENVDYIKLESIYKITPLSKKDYVYAIVPTHKEIKLPILEILSDKKEHRKKDMKKILAEDSICDERNGEKITRNKLKEKIDWSFSFAVPELKSSKLIKSKKAGYLIITDKGLDKLNENKNI